MTVAGELDRRGLLRRIGGAPYLRTRSPRCPPPPTPATTRHRGGEGDPAPTGGRPAPGWCSTATPAPRGADIGRSIDRAQAEIYDVTQRRTAEDVVPLEALLQSTMDEIDAISSNRRNRHRRPDRVRRLHEVTTGLHGGQMVIIAANGLDTGNRLWHWTLCGRARSGTGWPASSSRWR